MKRDSQGPAAAPGPLVVSQATQRRRVATVERILAEAAERDRVATRPVTRRAVRPGLSVFSVRHGSDQGEAERP